MKDLLLDKNGDLYLTPSGDISLTDSVRQAILIRKFGSLLGLPYFSEVFVKNPNIAVIEQLFREQILSVEEVVGVEDIRIQINKRLRICTVIFRAQTTQGAIEEEVMIDGL